MRCIEKCGFKKFILVVLRVAIREGTLKNLEVTLEHFQSITDCEVERKFAQALDKREDVKLPNWFKVGTPLGEYNPDWAIVKVADVKLYFVHETKSTRDFMKLRNSEVDNVRCGQAHFRALGVGFKVVTHGAELSGQS